MSDTRATLFDFLISGLTSPTTGKPIESGSVEFYESGTTTEKYVWTEKEKTNGYYTYDLSSIGTATLYGEGEYKVVVKDSNDVTIDTIDPVRLRYETVIVDSVTSTPYAQTTDNDILLVDTTSGDITINLLPAASWTRTLTVIPYAGTNTITLDAYGSETINGSTTLDWNYDANVELYSDGSNIRTLSIKSAFSDADGDTQIQVEESTDEDKIRFDAGGSEVMVLDKSGIDISFDSTETYQTIFDMFTSSLPDAGIAYVRIGVDNSSLNHLRIFLSYAGDGSSSNYASYGLTGAGDIRFNADGSTYVNGDDITTNGTGGLTIYDLDTSQTTYPMDAYSFSLPDAGVTISRFGVNGQNYNNAYVRLDYTSTGSTSNSARFGLYNAGYIKFNGDGSTDISGATTISDSGSTTSEIPLKIYAPNIANSGVVSTYFGKDGSTNDFGYLAFGHVSDGSTSNYIALNVSSGSELKMLSSGAVTLNDINILPTSTTVSGSGDISAVLFRLSTIGKIATMQWGSMTFGSSTNTAVSSTGTVASAYRPAATVYSGFMRSDTSNQYIVKVDTGGTITVYIYDYSGAASAVTALSAGGSMSWVLP